MPLTASYKLSAEEMALAQRLHFRRSPACAAMRRSYALALAVFAACGIFWLTRRHPVAAMGFFAVFAGLLLAPSRIRRLVLKQYSRRPDRDTLVTYEFTPDDIIIKGVNSASTVKWSAFRRVLQTPRGFLLYPNDQSFHWLPDHAFGNAANVEQFSQLARAKVARFTHLAKA